MIDDPDLLALIARYEARLQALEARPQEPPGPTDIQVQNKSFTANEGQHCIIECPPAGLSVTLPRARPQNRNARITFTLRNSNPVRFLAVNGKVNSRTSGVMAAPGTFDAISDGSTGWSISVLAAGPTALPPLSADFVVGVANPGLPNARVATASVEITPSIAVANVISWALNASSVVFAKLANLTGLSVLGRAANSTGVMAAITAGGAQQYLRSNAAGTSLEWADPASASIINNGVTFQRAAFTGAVQAAQNSNVTSFGNLAALSVLANATNASAIPAALAGTAAFQHLRVNAAGTGLEWSVLTSGDFPAGTVPLTGIATQAANTFVANATAGVASPTAVASNAQGVMGRTSGNIQSIDSSVQSALIRGSGSVFWGTAGASQVLCRNAAGDLGFQSVEIASHSAITAKSVVANATNASAVPTAFAGTVANTYLRVNAANTALEYGALPAGVMPTIQPGSFIGLQITAGGAAAAIEITGAEAGQNIRFNSQVSDSTSTGAIGAYVVNANTTQVVFQSGAGNISLNGISAPTLQGQEVAFICAKAYANTVTVNDSVGTVAANDIKTPRALSFTMQAGESFVARNDNGTWRVIARSHPRSSVQVNSGTISPAETLNFTSAASGGTNAAMTVTAGVAAVEWDTVKATQLSNDVGTDAIAVLTSALRGLRPGLFASQLISTTTASVVRNAPYSYTIPANTLVARSCYLFVGFCTVVRGATATASTLQVDAQVAGTLRAAMPAAIASSTGSGSFGGFVAYLINCGGSGVSGSAAINMIAANQWRGGTSVVDLSINSASFTINTTIANTIDIGITMGTNVAGLSTNWTNGAFLRIF